MDTTEFKTELKRRSLNTRQACTLIYAFTGSVVEPRDVDKQLQVKGRMSQRESAMWRLLFKLLDLSKGAPHVAAA